jgi:hypothetical protein
MNEQQRESQACHHALLKSEQILADIGVDIDDSAIKLLLLSRPFPDQIHEIFDLVDLLMDSVFVLTLGVENEFYLHMVSIDEDVFIEVCLRV